MNGHIQAVNSFLFLTSGITRKTTTKRLRSNYVLELLTLGASIPYGPGEISGASVADHCCFTGFLSRPDRGHQDAPGFKHFRSKREGGGRRDKD